jgi:hypothetical protein
MSTTTDILNRVRADLLLIKADNGYTNELPEVFEGYVPLTSGNTLPRCCYYLAAREPINKTNDGTPCSYKCELWLHVQVIAETGDMQLTRTMESWIEDMHKWLFSHSGITENKWLTMDTAISNVIWGSKDLDKIDGVALWDQNRAEIAIKLTFNYTT